VIGPFLILTFIVFALPLPVLLVLRRCFEAFIQLISFEPYLVLAL